MPVFTSSKDIIIVILTKDFISYLFITLLSAYPSYTTQPFDFLKGKNKFINNILTRLKTNNCKTLVEFDGHKFIKSNSSHSREKKTDRQIKQRETEKIRGEKTEENRVRVCA